MTTIQRAMIKGCLESIGLKVDSAHEGNISHDDWDTLLKLVDSLRFHIEKFSTEDEVPLTIEV